jgi:N-ethylmaleimide reductase
MDIRHRPLLEPIQLGDVTLPNCVVMAPMMRARADNANFLPSDLHAETQRVSAGLIISRA